MNIDMGQLPRSVNGGPMIVFAPESVGSGDEVLVPQKRKVGDLESQVVSNAQIAAKAKRAAIAVKNSKEAKKKIIQNAIALTRSTTGKFKKGVALGWWPYDDIKAAATSAYTAVADKATELVTGISKEQIEATEKVAEAQTAMIKDRVATGAMTAQKGAELTNITQQAKKDAQEAASVTNVLKDTATIATNKTLNALGLPSIEKTWKYIKYAIPVVGGLIGMFILWPYISAARAPGKALYAVSKRAGKKLEEKFA